MKRRTFLSGSNCVQVEIGTVLITRTSWKNNDFIVSSGEVRRELVERCIKQFEELGYAQAEFYFNNTEHCTVSQTDYKLHFDA